MSVLFPGRSAAAHCLSNQVQKQAKSTRVDVHILFKFLSVRGV